ncbi:alpha/beta hydrolase [Emticicia sp. 17c]|uniref:alpha/beta hydrolase n=1 Tax=Emticicia sp. 17c TaxID=3127704 RepID=UPI00301D6482
MKKRVSCRHQLLLFWLLLFPFFAWAQPDARQAYLADLKSISRAFSGEYYPNYATIYALPEKVFIHKIDSARQVFVAVLEQHRQQLDQPFADTQQTEIKYYFDKLLLEYPISHAIYGDKAAAEASAIPERMAANLPDFNKPELLKNSDFVNYAQTFFSYQISRELRKSQYKNHDNKHLEAIWKLIPLYVQQPACKDFWQYDYLYKHIDNDGINHIEPIYNDFLRGCRDTAYTNPIKKLYAEDLAGRQGHLIQAYKTVGPYKLYIHLFGATNKADTRKPVMVYFHGGSWSEGKPDWFFPACEEYARKGWVACAVEYRTYGRHGTLPFEAVKDARSAIRWLRQHGQQYGIDTSRIVASGNSAGGHLVLATALADNWNEKTDNLHLSATPNVLLINAGVYDLTDATTAWLRKDLADKNQAREISPLFLVRKQLPPTLVLHGTNDRNVSYASAKRFVEEMRAAGNTTIEFHTLEGAGHFIWFDKRFGPEVSKFRQDFLTKLGY